MSVLVGRPAPDFTTAAVLPNGDIQDKFNLLENIQGKYALLCFYPLDFTFVCPTELIALDRRLQEFKSRNVELFAISIDSAFSHHKWRNTPVSEGGIGEVGYTMIADTSHRICQAYGVEHPEAAVAFRGSFLIDRDGIVRSQIVNDLPLGRNVDELIRIVDAWQFFEKHGEVCPANWQKGKSAIKPTAVGIAEYLSTNESEL